MKIAIPTQDNGLIDNHFGHCQFYTIYTVSDEKKVIGITTLPSPKGCGCKSNIASTLQEIGVSVMLAGGIGQGAINKLNEHNIEVVRNCTGLVDELIVNYLAGKVIDSGDVCNHHDCH